MPPAEVRHGSQRDLPANPAFGHVHGRQHSPRTWATGQTGRRLKQIAEHTKRCTCLSSVFTILVALFWIRKFCAWYEPHLGGHIVNVREEQAASWVECVTAPVHSANVSRNNQCALKSRRCEYTFIAQRLQAFAAGFTFGIGDTPRIAGRNFMRH